ncbi:MAG: TonB-dependent receptor [Acidaminococcaceae bacterium]|nr:TonB-dependent receptor [Acidaminococcaceae bacterium]
MKKRVFSISLRKKVLLSLLILGSFCPAVQAAEAEDADTVPVFNLDQIVITASRSEEKIKDTPASISVVSAQDIKDMHIQNIDQALVKIPGIYVARLSSIGSTTSQTVMRGINAANSTAVLLNGQQINDSYNGSVTWSSIPVDSVERIEVLRGPASTLYGGNAMGGVVNIITKDIDKQYFRAKVSFGSNGTQNHGISYGNKITDKLSFGVNYEKKKSKGYVTDPVLSSKAVAGMEETTTNTGASRWIIGNKGKRQWDEDIYGASLKYKFDQDRALTFNFSKDKYAYSYSRPQSYINEDIIAKAGTYFSTPGSKAVNRYDLDYDDKAIGLKMLASYTKQYDQHDTSISKATDSTKPNSRLLFDLQKNQQLSARDKAVFGLNFRRDKMNATVWKLSDKFDSNSKTSIDSYANGKNESYAAYFSNEHKFTEKWLLNTGIRYDHWSTEGTILLPGKTDPIHYGTGTFSYVSPSVALQYRPDENTNTYISWGKAFEAPSLYRMYSSSYSSGVYNIANPNLKPQKVESYEIGIKKNFSVSSSASLSVYHNRYTDLLYKNAIGIVDGMNATRYENAGRAETNGFELEYNQKIGKNLAVFANYTYQNPQIKKATSPSDEGKLVTAIPKKVFRAGVVYDDGKWSSMLVGQYVSKRWSTTGNTDKVNGVYTSYDPYFILNFNIGYQFNKNCNINFGIENLLNREYFDYYYQPGRTYDLQVKFSF